MKKIIVLATTVFLLLHADAQKNITAPKVIADYLKAIGGEEELKKIRTICTDFDQDLTATGKAPVSMAKNGTTKDSMVIVSASIGKLLFERKEMLPNKFLATVTSDSPKVPYDYKMVFDGTGGFVSQNGIESSIPEVILARLERETHLIIQMQYLSDPEIKLEYKGVEKVNGNDCYVIRVYFPDGGGNRTEYYDINSKLLARRVDSSLKTMEIIEYRDYKKVDHVLFSHKLIITHGNGSPVQEQRVTGIQLNKGVSGSDFVTGEKKSNHLTDNLYIDYQQYMGGDFREEIMSGNNRTPKTVKELQDSAVILRDEGIPGDSITTILRGTRILSDEEIYAQRKKSVFLIGKLKKVKDTAGAINFDLIGTAFAISGDGICVTNYHVLQDIIQKNDSIAAIDSSCFIETVDKKVYFVEKILAYSHNNDLAIFKVNTRGGQLQPLSPGKPAAVGAAVYCISHPQGNFYYFSKGMVARNLMITNQLMAEGKYESAGRLPIRMEITADYGVGSSGGPILDKYGNIVGIVCSTRAIGKDAKNGEGNDMYFQQMVIKQAIPVKALLWLLKE